MEEFMSENNPGAAVPQSDNRGNEQNKEKRQRFDPAKQEGRKNNYNRNNRRRRNNGQRQGGNDNNNNKRADNAEIQAEGGNRNQGRNRQGGRDQNKKFNRDQNQQGENRKQFNPERRAKNKRSREIDAEVAKNVKKVETIEDIRSDNARITKEIYLEIASLKNINLN